MQGTLRIHIIGQKGKCAVEVDRGGDLGVEHCALSESLELRQGKIRQVLRQPLKQQLLHASGSGGQKIHLSGRNTRVAQSSVAVLALHASSGETWQIQPLIGRAARWAEGAFHQPIDAASTLVLSIREHNEGSLQPGHRLHIASIELSGQRVPNQLHADPIEILHDQQIICLQKLLLQLIRSEAQHRGAAKRKHRDHGPLSGRPDTSHQ